MAWRTSSLYGEMQICHAHLRGADNSAVRDTRIGVTWIKIKKMFAQKTANKLHYEKRMSATVVPLGKINY